VFERAPPQTLTQLVWSFVDCLLAIINPFGCAGRSTARGTWWVTGYDGFFFFFFFRVYKVLYFLVYLSIDGQITADHTQAVGSRSVGWRVARALVDKWWGFVLVHAAKSNTICHNLCVLVDDPNATISIDTFLPASPRHVDQHEKKIGEGGFIAFAEDATHCTGSCANPHIDW
jgi:hypothetical protein